MDNKIISKNPIDSSSLGTVDFRKNLNIYIKELEHEQEMEKLKGGYFGKFFGTKENAIIFTLGVSILLLIIIVGAATLIPINISPTAIDLWERSGILIGTFLGFLGGHVLKSN